MTLTKIKTKNIKTGTITTEKIVQNIISISKPKITNVSIANSSYYVKDDTAVNIGGGYIVVTGTGFKSGAMISVNQTSALSTTFVNSTTLRAQVDSANASTYNLYVVNPDGTVGIKLNGLTYSGVPTWVTSSTLANVISNTAFTGSLSATGATSYANTTALPAGFNLVTANGYYYGNISVGSDTTYSFTIDAIDAELQDSPRTFSLNALLVVAPTSVEYLVVAGGGGGGFNHAGGGGAGGYRTGTLSVSAGTPYTVTVGSGGAGQTSYRNGRGSSGTSSIFSSITSAGGGGGGSRTDLNDDSQSTGAAGGSGGGGGGNDFGSIAGGSGNTPSTSPSQGNNGGSGSSGGVPASGGGGGGAGGNGTNAGSQVGGNGGAGTSSPISGSSVTYAGGGGGGCYAGGTKGSGGSSVGGDGGVGNTSAVNGTVNSGSGGGGGGGGGSTAAGATGGSGIVIIRYADSFAAATSTTGSPTVTTSGGFRIYQFTGSGSITF